MKNLVSIFGGASVLAAVCLVFALSHSVKAQTNTTINALISSACATTSQSYPVGKVLPVNQGTDGQLCINSSQLLALVQALLPAPVPVDTFGNSYTNLTANGTSAAIKSGVGILHKICINTPGATDTITVYDSLTGSGTKIATINDATSNATCLIYDVQFSTGLSVVVAGTTAPDVTITWH